MDGVELYPQEVKNRRPRIPSRLCISSYLENLFLVSPKEWIPSPQAKSIGCHGPSLIFMPKNWLLLFKIHKTKN